MTILKRLWSLLSVLGPAPAGKGAAAESGPKSLEASDRGMFDDPDGAGDGDGGDEADGGEEEREERPKGRREDAGDDAGDDADADEGDEADGDDADDDAGARSEREDAGDDADGDDADADGDDDADEEEDLGEDDTALSLRESWESRLEADARANPDAPPRLALGQAGVREAARKRFDDLRAKDEEGKFDADAIFEVAMDAALQVVGAYHDGVAAPAGDRVEKSLRNVQVGRSLTSFRREVGERLTPEVEKRMADLYQGFAGKYGWRRADKVPLKTLFRMAGGALKGGKSAKATGKKPEAEDKADRQKRAALGAAGGPRALGRTRAEDGAGKPRKEDRALREFAADTRARAPFFTLDQ